MANTFKAIASYTVPAGGVSSITFSSIPQTFTDFLIFMSLRSNVTGSNWQDWDISFNGNTTQTNYDWVGFYGYSGTSVGSNGGQTAYSRFGIAAATSSNATNAFSAHWLYVSGYSSTTTYKPVSMESIVNNNSSTTGFDSLAANIFKSNSAITSFTLSNSGGSSLVQNSVATLYGIKNS